MSSFRFHECSKLLANFFLRTVGIEIKPRGNNISHENLCRLHRTSTSVYALPVSCNYSEVLGNKLSSPCSFDESTTSPIETSPYRLSYYLLWNKLVHRTVDGLHNRACWSCCRDAKAVTPTERHVLMLAYGTPFHVLESMCYGSAQTAWPMSCITCAGHPGRAELFQLLRTPHSRW